MVDCVGKSLSYAPKLIPDAFDIAYVMIAHPRLRASSASTGSSKKSQTCAPFPDLDRSTAGCRPKLLHAFRYNAVSRCQPSLSKSATSTHVVQSASSTYMPITSRKSSRLPLKCSTIARSLTEMNLLAVQSTHFIPRFALVQRGQPFVRSLAHVGEYPMPPPFLAKPWAYTSSRPLNSDLKSAILSTPGLSVVTRCFFAA